MGRPYEKLKFYQDICEIRRLIYIITKQFPKGNLKLVSQMRDAARSAKQNIREGYRRDTIGEFLHGIKISCGSLEELEGDIDDCFEDGLINNQDWQKLKSIFDKTNYLINRYIDSLNKLAEKGLWKSRFKR